MNKGFFCICIISLLGILFGCHGKDSDLAKPEDFERFTFGISHCECIGQCAALFEFENDQLRKGEGTGCFQTGYSFNGQPLDEVFADLAQELIDAFPEQLLIKTETTYGCPDCADQGTYLIEVMDAQGLERNWRIDTRTEDLPAFLIPYQQKIQETLSMLP